MSSASVQKTPRTAALKAWCHRKEQYIQQTDCVHCFWTPTNTGLRAAYRTSKACANDNVTLMLIESPQQSDIADEYADFLDSVAHVAATMRAEGHTQTDIGAFGRGLVLLLGLDKE